MTAKTFRLIRSGPLPGARNMALDEALAGAGAAPVPTVRLYGWDPWTLSLGHFQRVAEEDLAPFLAAGFGVTRRPTGGGAILHGDEVTYAVILPAGDPRIPRETAASYAWLHAAVREALSAVGVATSDRGGEEPATGADPFFCFERAAPVDILARGRKIVGSAQRRTATAFLQHGSIPLSPNGSAPAATSACEERSGSPVDAAELEEALARAFARALGAAAEPARPGPAEEKAAGAFEREKYGNREWILRPWRGSGRATGLPAMPRPQDPLRALRAAVGGDGLRVLGSVGGSRPVFAHARLRAADAAAVRRVEERALGVERDPWDSTFRRSAFEGAQGAAGPEGRPPTRLPVEEETLVLHLLYGDPAAAVSIEADRFNFADLGDGRTGEPRADACLLLADLLSRAPSAVAGPGARALLEGRRPAPLPRGGALACRTAAVAVPRSPLKS